MRFVKQCNPKPAATKRWDRHSCLSTRRKDIPVLSLFPFFLLLLWIPIARSAITVSLPTEGRYRPGRYLPVRLEHGAGQGSISLQARGTIPTELPSPDSSDVIVPWLPVSDSAGDAVWKSADGGSHPVPTPLRALAADEKLVAFAGPQEDAAKLLFPGGTIVPIQLDESRPLLDPVEAWECLDAVVLSPSAIARVNPDQRAALLAAGTTLAVRSDSSPPDQVWPWKRQGAYWVLAFAPAGPVSIVEPAAYEPTYGWERGWPVAFRHRIMFIAVLFCILSLGTLLWRSRGTALAFVAVAIIFIGAGAMWYRRQSAVLKLESAFRIEDGPVSQFDLWTWQSPVRSADASFPIAGVTHPYLGTLRQIEQTRLRLVCRPDGRPDRFDFHLEPGQSLAMLSRQVRVASPMPDLSPASAASHDFADSLYLQPGRRVQGQYVVRESAIPVMVIVGLRP
jgi:hypothetical protein